MLCIGNRRLQYFSNQLSTFFRAKSQNIQGVGNIFSTN